MRHNDSDHHGRARLLQVAMIDATVRVNSEAMASRFLQNGSDTRTVRIIPDVKKAGAAAFAANVTFANITFQVL